MANNLYKKNDPTFSTRAIHEGNVPETWASLDVVPPITLSTTFKQYIPGQPVQFEYGRSGNPTRNSVEQCLASLESAKHGIVFASGLAATTTIIHTLEAGAHIVTSDDLYGGTNRYFRKVAAKFGVTTDFVDTTNPDNVKAAMKPNTRLIWIETPTNPTLKITDIAAIAKVVKEHGNSFLVVDNTFLTSYFQRPLELGADVVVHSCTKYLNGHSDVIMGAIMLNRDDLHDQLRALQNNIGGIPSPFDCYLLGRSLRTLSLRMKAHMEGGLVVAQFLEKHACVEKVIHPGLPSHPQHELATRQSYGHSGMVTFYIKGADLEKSKKFFENLKIFTLAESLGGFESLCELPSVMTHASVSKDEREKLGITDNLIRLSVGLENPKDLIDDLDQALLSIKA